MQNSTFIIVDDTAVNLEILQILFDQLDIKVHSFQDPLLALEYIKSHPVTTLLTDYMMPNINGIELINEAKNFHPHLRSALITALRDENSTIRDDAYKAGVDCFITHPISYHLFQECIEIIYNEKPNALYCKKQKRSCINRDKIIMPSLNLCCIDEAEEEKEIVIEAVDAIENLHQNFHTLLSCSSKLSYAAEIIHANHNLEVQETLLHMKKFSYLMQEHSQKILENDDARTFVLTFSMTLQNWLTTTFIHTSTLWDTANFSQSLQADLSTLEMVLGVCVLLPEAQTSVDDFFF